MVVISLCQFITDMYYYKLLLCALILYVFRLLLQICNLQLRKCQPTKPLEGCWDQPWETSSKAAFLSPYGKMLFKMHCNSSVLFEQEGTNVVACLCWQEWYEVFNICLPFFCNFNSFVADIEIKVQATKFSL